jgi:hypothetical protein
MKKRELTVRVERGEIVIRIGIDVVALSTEMAPHMDRVKVTDRKEWARSVVAALDREEEDGSTPVTRMLDDAYYNAADQGEEGIKIIEGEDDEHEKGGVEIMQKDGSTTFFEEGLTKVKKGDMFRTFDPPGGEGVGPWVVAESDPVRSEHVGRDGKKRAGWKVKSTPVPI